MSLTFSQITSSVQNAIKIPIGLFPTSQTTPAKAKQELDGLADSLTNLTAAVQANSSSMTAAISNLPKGLAVGVSFAKATSAVKNVTKPISAADATSLLNSYRVVQTKTLAFITFYKTCSSTYEGIIPGVYQFGLTTLQQLFTSLSNALATVDPSTIPAGTITGIQAPVLSAIGA